MTHTLSHPAKLDELLLYRLNRILALAGVPITRLCEGQWGITWREWRVIATLQPGVSLLSSELAERTHLDRARTSRCISSLLGKGLIDRQVLADDQRKAKVSLTAKGRDIFEAMFPVVAKLNAQLLDSLSAQELAVLDKALSSIQSQVQCIQGLEDMPKANRRLGKRASAKSVNPP